MNTAELLNAIDFEQVRALARYHGCMINTHSKLELIKHVHVALRSKQRFIDQWSMLPMAHKRLLQSLLYDYRETFVFDDLLARATFARYDGSFSGEAHALIDDVCRHGWLYQNSDRSFYRMPLDLKNAHERTLQRLLCEQLQQSASPLAFREERRWLIEDLQSFLQFVGDRGLDLTQSGTIQKKWLQQYMRFSNVAESLDLEGFRFGYGRSHREYPSRFALLYDFCCAQKWVEERGRKLVLTDEGASMFANGMDELTETQHMSLLLRFWFRSYRRAVPNVAALVKMIAQVCQTWTTATSLAATLQLFVKPYYYDDAEQVILLRVLPMMISFGLLRVATNGEQSDLLVQATEQCEMLLSPQLAVVKRNSL